MLVREGTIVIYSDIACPWASLAMHRLHDARARLGLDDEIAFDLRAFPLELINERPTPKRIVDAEIKAIAEVAPELGWTGWTTPEHTYPGTVLLALEAVQAAKIQGLGASEQLDLALRRAFYAESRPIGLRSEILAVAEESDAVDADALAEVLDDGAARRDLIRQWRQADSDEVTGSPHVFLPDGSDVHNPGIEMHKEDDDPARPVIDHDDPGAIEDLIKRAAS